MLPASISRNVLLSLIIALAIALFGILYALFFKDLGIALFSPSAAEGVQFFFLGHKFLGFLVSIASLIVAAVLWNDRLNNGEVLIQEDFSQIYNFSLLGCLLYILCPFPELFLSILCLTLGVSRIFQLSKSTDTAYSISFDAGFFIGLATYFNFTSVIYILFLWLGILIISSIQIKDLIWSILGLVLPFLMMSGIDLLFNTNIARFPSTFISESSIGELPDWKVLTFVGLSIFVIISGYFALAQSLRRSSVRTKNIVQVLNIFFLFAMVQGILMVLSNGWELMLFALLFPVSFYWHCNVSGRERYVFNNFLYVAWTVFLVLCFV